MGEASALLGVAPPTLRRWVAEGRIPALATPGGHHRLARGAVEALLPHRAATSFPAADAGTADRHPSGLPPGRPRAGGAADLPRRRAEGGAGAAAGPWSDHHRLDPAVPRGPGRGCPGGGARRRADRGRGVRPDRRALGASMRETVATFLRFRMPFVARDGAAARRRGLDAAGAADLLEAVDRRDRPPPRRDDGGLRARDARPRSRAQRAGDDPMTAGLRPAPSAGHGPAASLRFDPAAPTVVGRRPPRPGRPEPRARGVRGGPGGPAGRRPRDHRPHLPPRRGVRRPRRGAGCRTCRRSRRAPCGSSTSTRSATSSPSPAGSTASSSARTRSSTSCGRASPSATPTGPLDPVLDRLFQAALRAGRRAHTWFDGSPRSLADVALDRIAPDDGRARRAAPILVVGAGRMGRLAAFAAHRRGARVVVTNRTDERAAALAAEVGGTPSRSPPTASSRPSPARSSPSAGPWPPGPRRRCRARGRGAEVVDLSSPPAVAAGPPGRARRRASPPSTTSTVAPEFEPQERLRRRLERLVSETGREYCAVAPGARRRAGRSRPSPTAPRASAGPSSSGSSAACPTSPPTSARVVEQMSHRLVAGAPPRAAGGPPRRRRPATLERAARDLFGV